MTIIESKSVTKDPICEMTVDKATAALIGKVKTTGKLKKINKKACKSRRKNPLFSDISVFLYYQHDRGQ